MAQGSKTSAPAKRRAKPKAAKATSRPSHKTAMQRAQEAKAETGLLPHEWLLKVALGEPIIHHRWRIQYNRQGTEISRELVVEEMYADFKTRVEAAKAAAPFFAPRLSTMKVQPIGGNGAPAEVRVVFVEPNRTEGEPK
jgi:hypothetical protein